MKTLVISLLLAAGIAGAQELDPAKLLQPATDMWPSFNGDYSGRRNSPLKQINSTNVQNLSLSWLYRVNAGSATNVFGTEIKATPLLVNGILYFTLPDLAAAVDARTGRELWHYNWESQGGIHIGNRGVGIYGNWLFFETLTTTWYRSIRIPASSGGVLKLPTSSSSISPLPLRWSSAIA